MCAARPVSQDPGSPEYDSTSTVEGFGQPTRIDLLWRSRAIARLRHRMGWLRRTTGLTTRTHAKLVLLSGGRIRRSFIFTGGMPILVITTIGRHTGKLRSTPLGFVPFGAGVAVIASNAGNDRTPAWWLNLQSNPQAEVLINRHTKAYLAREATELEEMRAWATIARLNPGFDEYRNLTTRKLPVVILEPQTGHADTGGVPGE